MSGIQVFKLEPDDYVDRVIDAVNRFVVDGERILIINPVSNEQMWVDKDNGELVKVVYQMTILSRIHPGKTFFYDYPIYVITRYMQKYKPDIFYAFLD